MKTLMGRQLGKGTGVAQIPEKGTDILQALEEKRNDGMGTVIPEIPTEGKGTETMLRYGNCMAYLRAQRGGGGNWHISDP